MSDGATVRIDTLTKRFPTGDGWITAVDQVSLDIPAGTAVAVTGPSGSGKSTLLHIVGAIERAGAGTVTVDDLDITALRRRRLAAYRRTGGLVFQRYHLLTTRTALRHGRAPVLPYRRRYDRAARRRDRVRAV